MSTKSQVKVKKKVLTASSDKGEDDDDVGAEAAAAAAESNCLFFHPSSNFTWQRTPVITKAKKNHYYQTNNAKVMRHESVPCEGGSAQEECDQKEVQMRYSYEHSADGCTIMPRPRMEEFASSMRQRSRTRNTPVMDAQIGVSPSGLRIQWDEIQEKMPSVSGSCGG
eukprot:scaffold3964_cov77-Skeletonema_marinoi.AAC.28